MGGSPYRESSNNEPTHLHGGSDVARDQVSDICMGDVIVGGVVVPLNTGVFTHLGGIITGIRPRP